VNTVRETLTWPFFDDTHRVLAARLAEWVERDLPAAEHPPANDAELDARCRQLVSALGRGGWLRYAAPAPEGDGGEKLDARTLCLVRETLARTSGLTDFAFAMQGLGGGPISLFGSPEQRARFLPSIVSGEAIAAFAISESHAGSDLRAMRTSARRDGDGWVLDGEKCWISNAGLADRYVVFARIPEMGERAFGAFVVDATDQGFHLIERVRVVAPHPLGTIALRACRVGNDRVIGAPGDGLKVALATLDVFRPTVGAAALGFARRALAEAVAWTRKRTVGGRPLADQQLTQVALAEMATDVDASALLVYRAAWARDVRGGRITREAAMAKLGATEAAQRVVDRAVQLFGARGVIEGNVVEELYREVRALRIYEGTSEVQKLVIASRVMEESA
jgi:alkylation response protein AidB-like acyl-CoA dehydrogenase